MNHSESINELAAALAVAQGNMKPARMNAVNPFLKNKYADLGAVMDACRDVLASNGLSFVQMAFTPPMDNFGPAVGVETMLMHKSGQWLSEQFVLPVGDEKGKSVMQVAGSAISYARRYALASMLGIVADEDTDGNAPTKAQKSSPQAATTNGNGNGNGHKPAPVSQPSPPALADELFPAIPESLRRKFHAVGSKVYGDEWDDKRAELVSNVTKGKSRSSNDLTREQMEKLVEGIEKKLAQQLFVVDATVDAGYAE